MSNVTVQEALNAAINCLEKNEEWDGQFQYDIQLCKSALSEIEKCEPELYMAKNLHNKSYATSHSEAEARLFLLQSGLKVDGIESEVIALCRCDTSPQPRDWVNKDLLETDDGKWDATLMALWRRLQRHQNGADFWNESEIPEDEMYIFRAHFATALLASPLKHLNTKG